ncbi:MULTISPECIES: hypothetical protein [Nitrospirillum]|uniref:Uncharacterized protein n=1 Tax=Nitrospirillum amazonense TaxID=28077 RepID=A0A560H4J4_9PROT|nr:MULTISPECIES: hypothetical protein [Nitrospirillum]MDZ5648185.1 hypothetical protein [Nitrospirillum sp. BR 11828]MEE3625295.1 hypothetical protein [Nitrospirillum sp. BR 11752]TWB40540.1 hypothetical protein FBZ90_109143 [Nitrospirillum amazonense]
MTTPAPSPEAEALADAMDGLLSILNRTADLVAAGDAVEFAGLEDEATALCNAVVQLPPPEARAFLPRLEAVLAALERLETVVKKANELTQGKATVGRAAAAYRRAEDPDVG